MPPTPPDSDSNPDPVLGIDLGTTNSLVALATGPAEAHVLPDRDGAALIPSVVYFDADGTETVGREARARLLDDPKHTVYSAKRLMGRAGAEVTEAAQDLAYPVALGDRDLARITIRNQQLSPEEISAKVLRAARDRARGALSRDVRRAVITVPAYFDDAQRQATKDAAELAGLDCLRIINEPTAAALAYGIDGSKDGTVLVYDLGGGTFDVSILKIHDGVFRVLATAGDTRLGGDDFDRLAFARLRDLLLQELGIDPDKLCPGVTHELRRAAEGLKIHLSQQETAALEIQVGERTAHLTLTRSEFEAAIQPLVQKTLDRCQQALRDAEVKASELDDVVLVGGSTRIPYVRSTLSESLGCTLRTEVDPDQAVALGAALQGAVLGGTAKNLLLLDVIPLSLGIETMGGVVSKLILRNATIPTSATEEFSTQVDNQTGVDINIYQGEREMVSDCRHLGSFKLTGIPPMPAGLPRVAVTFLVDADGVLTVRAVESRTGTQAGIQVVPSFGLTRDEVSQMMHDSIEHAVGDMHAREAIETRNKAQAMVQGTAKALDMADLPPDQVYSIRKGVKQLQKLLDADAPIDQLKPAVDELSKLTATIADDVISSAVHKALSAPAED